jgi:hypothetical protein
MWGKGTKMIRLTPLAAMFACCVAITAQQDSGTSNIQIARDDSQFANCSTVEEFARGYQPATRVGCTLYRCSRNQRGTSRLHSCLTCL